MQKTHLRGGFNPKWHITLYKKKSRNSIGLFVKAGRASSRFSLRVVKEIKTCIFVPYVRNKRLTAFSGRIFW